MDYDKRPLMYFKMFWKDEITEVIAEQTNIYSFQKLGKTFQVSKKEVEQSISIQMCMSILELLAFQHISISCTGLRKCTVLKWPV